MLNKGWRRVCVALAAIWCLAVLGYAGFERAMQPLSCELEEWQTAGTCRSHFWRYEARYSHEYPDFFASAIGPWVPVPELRIL